MRNLPVQGRKSRFGHGKTPVRKGQDFPGASPTRELCNSITGLPAKCLQNPQLGNFSRPLMTAEISTSDLIRRCRSGDEAARDQLFARYRHYLWLLAQAQIGGRLRA